MLTLSKDNNSNSTQHKNNTEMIWQKYICMAVLCVKIGSTDIRRIHLLLDFKVMKLMPLKYVDVMVDPFKL